MSIEIEAGVTMPPKRKAGRKHGSKDSKPFANRGRPRKTNAVKSAAEDVRNGECATIEEAANRHYDEYAKISSYTLEAKQQRFNYFTLKIVEELKANPKKLSLSSYRKLGDLHKRKMKSPRYKTKYHRIHLSKLKAELKTLGLIVE